MVLCGLLGIKCTDISCLYPFREGDVAGERAVQLAVSEVRLH